MKVCIAEKPSVAKEIAQVIGANAKKNGYFEGNGYQVTWTFGHFCTLLPPEDYESHWKRWDLSTLPMLPKRFDTKLISNDGVKKQFSVIQQLFHNASLVINCGDAGQEGELIQRWVLKKANYNGEVKRLWISSLTTEAIKLGFDNLKPAKEFDNLYFAGSSRAIGDWLLGMNATRLYTLKYGGYKQVLSIGRVQTPTLAMLVERFHEIENFVPKPYWELQTKYRSTIFKNTEGKFLKKEDGEILLSQITGQELEIKKITQKEGKEYAPKLFDLTGLQVFCNNKFGFTAEITLKLVQGLYEKKVVTYPRVDTTFLPNDLYPKVPGILKGLKTYASFTAPILNKPIRKSAKVFNDKKVTDHHAIIPTGEQKSLNTEEQKVYDIVTRRFIAVFHPDCKVAKTQVEAAVTSVQFVAKGKEILEEGWRVLFPKEKKNAEGEEKSEEEEESILPSFVEGEKGPHEPSFSEKTTKPPKNFTEASLLRAMETAGKQVEDEELRDLMKANGIGRPSTRANIIETLFKRKYTERRKKQVLPTPMGVQLIGTIQNELLKSAALTGQWERQLKKIEDGEFGAGEFIVNMKKMVNELVFEVKREAYKPRLSAVNEAPKTTKKTAKTSANQQNNTCPKCNKGAIVKGKNSFGCSNWKAGCKMRIPFEYKGKKLTDKQVERLVDKKSTTNIKGFIIDGKKKEGKLFFNGDFELQLEMKPPKQDKKDNKMPSCPKCNTGTLIRGKTAYGCSEWKKGCDFKFTFDNLKRKASGKKLTKELVLKIIAGPK